MITRYDPKVDLHPLPGRGLLGNGWPDYELREREVGARAACALEDGPLEWYYDLVYLADSVGLAPDELMTRRGWTEALRRMSILEGD